MAAWADDEYFDYSFPMYSPDNVYKRLGQLKARGFKITEVFFFDHSRNSQNSETNEWDVVDGLEFGNVALYFDGGGMENFCTKLWAFLGDGAEYHFRACLLEAEVNDDKLTNMAKWTRGLVTGATKPVKSMIRPSYKDGQWIWPERRYKYKRYGIDIDIPDYYSPYRGAQYNSDGSVTIGTYIRDVAPMASCSTTY
jgi:hypothetical protein